MSTAAEVVDRVRSFFTIGIWRERPEGGSRLQAFLRRVARVVVSTVRGFFEHGLTFRAAALTYFTALSIVPFLAFAFAVLKGLGAYHAFVQETVRPWILHSFGANAALEEASDRILHFVDQTDVSKLGTLGLVLLLYTSISLVSNVEAALNRIWGARGTRPLVRQITDYVTLLVTTPLLVVSATAFASAAQSSRFFDFLRGALHLGPVIDQAVRLGPVIVVWIGFFAVYMILPNVRTRAASAALGAAVAAVLWQGALVLHFQSQVSVSQYSALYSVLGAIPLFLVWMYVSWLVVLLGAEVAASHQYDQAIRQRLLAGHADEALKETLAVAASAAITRDFLQGAARPTAAQLARALRAPLPALEEVLGSLVGAGLLARTAGRDVGYLPGRDIDEVRAQDLRDAVRRDPHADELRVAVETTAGREIAGVLHALDEGARVSPRNVTLRELALAIDPSSARGSIPRRSARADGGADALDPEQPGSSA